MIISKEKLLNEAEISGFRPEILEKVIILMRILDGINKDAYLCERLVLKGGTALNLFYFGLPRLSVDIDLNYIGEINRDIMLKERPKVEERIERICKGLGLSIYRKPTVHAGGKMIWRYSSALGNKGNVEIDLNYMYRIPLAPISMRNSVEIAGEVIQNIAVLDIHELAAGKLSALVDRSAARDFFDAHYLLHNMSLNDTQLRVLFIIYSGMSRKCDVRQLDSLKIDYDEIEFQHRLVPMLKMENIDKFRYVKTWSRKLVGECQLEFARLLPLKENEQEFLTRLIDFGEVNPFLICDGVLAENVSIHPALQWAAFNAKRNSKLKATTEGDRGE